MLQQPDIAHYLLSLDVVKPRAVVDDELAVLDSSRRNLVFVVSTRDGDAFVVKQATPGTAATLAHEAAVLRALEDMASLAGQVPVVVHHDAQAARLVLRTARGARDWAKAHRTGQRHAAEPARRLGRLLAAVHAMPADAVPPPPAGSATMWGLTLPEPDLKTVLDFTLASRELVGLVQAMPRVCAKLRELAAAPNEQTTLTHGDLRWENCLRMAPNGSKRRSGVMIIDWELARGGDPALDLGTVIAEYLANWIESIPVVDGAELWELLHEAGRPLARDVLGAFWSGYRLASTEPPRLRRVAELAAVRLLQTAVERTQAEYELATSARLLLSVAENMLEAPEFAAYSLLELRE